MKKIAVYFDEPGVEDYPLSKAEYRRSYRRLSELVAERGAQFYIVRSYATYKGGGCFSRSWQFDGEGSLEDAGEVCVDLVYDKGDKDTFLADDIEVVNPRFINEVCTNKQKTYELFASHAPKSFVAANESEVKEMAHRLATSKAVVKPHDGFEGHGVQIVEVNDVERMTIKQGHFPVIVQEFIDSSNGAAGLADGIHDFRMVVVSGEIVMSFVRTPPPGSLLANVAQGGSLRFVPVDTIPDAARKIVDDVDAYFSTFGKRVYSVDVAFENERPYLIELNSRPAVWEESRGPEAAGYLQRLAELLTQ